MIRYSNFLFSSYLKKKMVSLSFTLCKSALAALILYINECTAFAVKSLGSEDGGD